jgi:predicted RNA-binding protein with PIN domain
MRLLIDGYNLLHFSGLLGKGRGGVWLQSGRKKLLVWLQEHLPHDQHARTCVVFDASANPLAVDSEFAAYGEIKVRFSLGYENADALIEELIEQHPTPKSLTVVSSDHRIQRCAKAHRCRFLDCDAWLDSLPRRDEESRPSSSSTYKPAEMLSAEGLSNYEVQLWLKEFGIVINEDRMEATESFPDLDSSHMVVRRQSKHEKESKPRKRIESVERSRRVTQIDVNSAEQKKKKPVPSKESGPKSTKSKPRTRGAKGSTGRNKHDPIAARKRAAKELPDGYQFPESEA